jgi:hypothetical protein
MNPDPVRIENARIVWPTREQRGKGLATIEEYAPFWGANPAVLGIKPKHALIVWLREIKHDEHYFQLVLSVEEALVAPRDFDSGKPIALTCVWNQPYLCLNREQITAPYSFYLYFGAAGVQRVREMREMWIHGKVEDRRFSLGPLWRCFRHGLPNAGNMAQEGRIVNESIGESGLADSSSTAP